MSIKNPVLLIAFTCLVISAGAQVKFMKISVHEALAKAREEDKVVFVYLEARDCDQCNEVANQGFENTVYARAVNNNAIPLWIKPDSKDFTDLDSMYQIGQAFGQLFIHPNGSLLHRYNGSTSASFMNMQQLDKALEKKERPDLEFMELQKGYVAGNRDFDLLYKLVAKKNELEMEHDLLTEEMVNLAPRDSANSVTFIRFVAEQAPLVDSKVSFYMRRNNRLFTEAWYAMPLPKRSRINGILVAKSKAKAIREKDVKYAERVAYFSSSTYTDARDARKYYEKAMIDYYRGVKDTVSFLQSSVKYYDHYLMSISVDSMKKADKERQDQMLHEAASPDKTLLQNGSIRQQSVSFAPATQYYTNELNAGAWTIYSMTHDPYYNSKALAWAKRAIEFFEQPAAMDTYARLLYRTGNRSEAIAIQEKAIEYSRERKMPVREFEEVLAKMKGGEASIDKY